MERELPIINLEGRDYLVDVNKLELREKANSGNIIAFTEMRDLGDGYSFDIGNVTVKIPEFVKLDPEGMAAKYHIDDLSGKTDFDVMVDQEAFYKRVNQGMLPTVDIAGHTFYVDLRMDMLRPHDDFSSEGIVFGEIEDYFSEETNSFIIPYNPKTHEFQELDFDKITEFPEELAVVQFPSQKQLDPVGWNRLGGWDIKDDLKQVGLKSSFKAEIIPWDRTWLKEIIAENQKTINKEPKNIKPKAAQLPVKPTKGKGKKM
jgi:hypothetical protein